MLRFNLAAVRVFAIALGLSILPSGVIAAGKAKLAKSIMLPVKAKAAAVAKKKPAGIAKKGIPAKVISAKRASTKPLAKIASAKSAKGKAAASRKLPAKVASKARIASKAKGKAAVAALLKQPRPLVAFAPKGALRPAVHKSKAVRAELRPKDAVKPIRTALLVPAIKQPSIITPDVEAELDPGRSEFMPEGPVRRFTAAYARFRFTDAISFQPNVTAVCLPERLKLILNTIAINYGPVTVASGWRDPEHNHAVGGAPRSEHLNCLAIDFLVNGDHQEVLDFLIGDASVGGYKLYRDGHFHIDAGPRRTW